MIKVNLLTEQQAVQLDGLELGPNVIIQVTRDGNNNPILSDGAVNGILGYILKPEHAHLSWVGDLDEIDYVRPIFNI